MWGEEGRFEGCSQPPFHASATDQAPRGEGWVPKQDGDSISTTVGGGQWGRVSVSSPLKVCKWMQPKEKP